MTTAQEREGPARIGIRVGDAVVVAKTVSESDVYLFAGITGDLHPNHVNEEYMRGGRFGRRVAHGALIVGLMSAASTRFLETHALDAVSYGYDRIRFTAPVFFGDTVQINYTVKHVDEEGRKAWAEVVAQNQSGSVVAVADHILKFIR